MIDFPTAPAAGTIVTSPDGISWTWDGTTWLLVGEASGGDGGSGFTFSQDTPPTVAVAGDTWFNTSTGFSYVWVDDGTSQQWVMFAPGSGGGGGEGGASVEVGTKVGVISAFSGDVIPTDSLICDGQAVPAGAEYDTLRAIVGTNVPDLRDRFLLGAGLSYGIRTVGGAATHALAVGEMPSHTHVQDAHNHLQDVHIHDSVYNTAANPSAPNGVYPGYGSSADAGWRPSQLVGVAATNIASTATNQYAGGGAAHNNMPPWYAVVYIIQAKPTMAAVAATASAGGGSGFTFVQDTKPVATKQGDTWLSTASTAAGGTSYVAIDNGTGVLNWVQFAPGTQATTNRGAWAIATQSAGQAILATGITTISWSVPTLGDIVYEPPEIGTLAFVLPRSATYVVFFTLQANIGTVDRVRITLMGQNSMDSAAIGGTGTITLMRVFNAGDKLQFQTYNGGAAGAVTLARCEIREIGPSNAGVSL